MMVILWFIVVFIFPVRTSSCQTNEYTSSDGQCCPMCNEGMKVLKDCTADLGTRCSPCESGTFMNKPSGLKSCFPCTPCDQGGGLVVKQECTKPSDTVCGVLSGFFCRSHPNNGGCSLADKHSSCRPGQGIKQPGTARSDTVCEDCQHGYFSAHGVNCTLWTECSEPQRKVKEGSSSRDVVCGNASSTRNRYALVPSFILFFLSVVGTVVPSLTCQSNC